MANLSPLQFNAYRLWRHIREIRLKLALWRYRKGISAELEDLSWLQLDGQIVTGHLDTPSTSMPLRRHRQGGDVSAIFVHAGAGYHSVENEKAHLQACADAARSAMVYLKGGGDAVLAVEIAIKSLEDTEITNAGYGSNLAIDGTVECDATIVDHFGRSGAVGAVGQILNPIRLARLVLENSTKPMMLRRVPPNLLVGQGATDFAFEHGVPVLPPDCLVSAPAKDRWLRWRRDLKKAKQNEAERASPNSEIDQEAQATRARHMAPLWNESQLRSPQLTATGSSDISEAELSADQPWSPGEPAFDKARSSTLDETAARSDVFSLSTDPAQSPAHCENPERSNQQGHDGETFQHLYKSASDDSNDIDDDSFIDTGSQHRRDTTIPPVPLMNLSSPYQRSASSGSHSSLSYISPVPSHEPLSYSDSMSIPGQGIHPMEDNITDTVGAIAIDCFGNIAAGSSSGGIGIKHKGRTGPAALVGIGTAVIPIESHDKLRTCVATVTSGTGEHMATTMAANTCASRLYFNQKRGKDGRSLHADEEEAIRSFVERDFMHHPSVKNSFSAGAIGVMAVKKTTEGVWLHFAHNTESFAIASMHSEEDQPSCVMSRGRGGNKITTGARSVGYRPSAEHTKTSKAKRQKLFSSTNPDPQNAGTIVPAVPALTG